MADELRKTGISVVGDIPWGTHFCTFYETTQDLLDILVPYIKAGFENSEFSLLVISNSELLTVQEAISALRNAVPDLDRHLAERRIEMVGHDEWFLEAGAFDLYRVANQFKEKLDDALARGYVGMRVNGSPAWLLTKNPQELREFEQEFDRLFRNERVIASCTYPLTWSGADELLDVAHTHQFAIARRQGRWEVLETPELMQAKQEIQRLNAELEQRVSERTSELAATNEALRREIVERKQAEDELRQQKEILQKIFDYTPVMIAFVGDEGRVELVNRAWEHSLGWTLRELDEQHLDIYALAYPDAQYRQQVLDFVAAATGEWTDLKVRVRDGQVKDITVAIVNLIDGTSLVIAQDITERKRAEAERAHLYKQVQASHEQLQTLSRQLLQAQEAERRAIARELHDEIGQQLTGLSLLLSTINQQLSSEIAQARLVETQASLRVLMEQVRNLALDLRPAILDDLGLVPALVWLFERYTTQTQIFVRLEHLGLEEQRFAPEVETAAYRIVQEALTNVARHAGVREVAVQLWADRATLTVVIEDRGHGFDPQTVATRASTGLGGMAERAALVGGSLTIETAPGAGTRLIASLPLDNDGEPRGQEHNV